MQLNPRPGRLVRNLRSVTAALFATCGIADESLAQASTEDAVNDLGKIRIDSALLVYQEEGGRVTTIEPMASLTVNQRNGNIFDVKFTIDSLTGATPNGAVPWKTAQTFVTPTKTSVSTSSTGASGRSIITTVNGVATRSYTAAPNSLPMDYGFYDQRFAVDAGYSIALPADWRVGFGGAYSTERDYRSASANLTVSKDLFDKNTTVSLAVNGEFDQSMPFYGTPTPLTVMNASMKGGNANKTVIDGVFGVTQVMNRYWLAQLNYSLGSNQGYQTDPYRIISVVDPQSGAPQQYLYENRPGSRLRQSVYFGNKLALGPTVTDLSARLYHDSWGISSVTAELSERIPIVRWLYVEPFARYYSQTKANFFQNYLVAGAPLPDYASSDSRLGQFDSATFGLKAGFKLGGGELYVMGSYYNQFGNGHPADAIGYLKNENLFSGVNAISAMIGYSFAFGR